MKPAQARFALSAALSTILSLGLEADDAVVLQDANRLTLRVLPCDVVARVAYMEFQASAALEVELAQRLVEIGSPVVPLDPRVEPRIYVRDGFVMNMWTYCEPLSTREVATAEYAHALQRLHAGMRAIDTPTPHFTDRVAEAQQIVSNRDDSPDLEDADRELLTNTLRKLRQKIGDRGAAEQLLHGEPHPGNVLNAKNGLLFIDLETCCRGPIEFDLAYVPDEVSAHYPGVDQELLHECQVLMLAMVAAWRWRRGDQHPDGRQMGLDFLSEILAALDRYGWDVTA